MIIGIDVGINGAIVMMTDEGWLQSYIDIPTIKIGKNNTIDINMLVKMLNEKLADDKQQFHLVSGVFIEKAQSMPGQGVVSTFNYGDSYGILKGIIGGMEYPYTLVHPRTWKAVMLRDMNRQSKDASRLRAKQLWPKYDWFDRKKDQHRAEAALIAEYGRRQKI